MRLETPMSGTFIWLQASTVQVRKTQSSLGRSSQTLTLPASDDMGWSDMVCTRTGEVLGARW